MPEQQTLEVAPPRDEQIEYAELRRRLLWSAEGGEWSVSISPAHAALLLDLLPEVLP